MNRHSILLKNGLIVTMDTQRRILKGDLEISGSKISRIGRNLKPKPGCRAIDVSNQFVIPGMIQTHTHLVQCLFRGQADDMSLIDWLKKRIWPMEFFHNKNSIRASCQMALAEMQLLGTTSVLDMATVHHTQDVLETVESSGMRYWGGKCLMDLKGSSGPLYESTKEALKESETLIQRWKGHSPLMNYALCPRFVVSCTEDLLKQCVLLQEKYDLLIHTHASESKEEIQLVKKRTGKNNVQYLNSIGMLNEKTVIVHGVHLTQAEVKVLAKNKTPLVHCPSSNLKLASGIAPIESYLKSGVSVSLGSDGAPCNNTMDPFYEMRLAALLQKPSFGPEALPAQIAFEMATLNGARALNAQDSIGSLEVGKCADVVTVDKSHPSVSTVEDPYSALVYSCSGRDVKHVFIHGKQVVRNRKHHRWSSHDIQEEGLKQLKLLKRRNQ